MSRLKKSVIPFSWNPVTITFTVGSANAINLSSFLKNDRNYPITYSVTGTLPSGVTHSAGTVSYNGAGSAATATVAFRATSGSYVADSPATVAVVAVQVNSAPVWNTAAGSIGSFTSVGGTAQLSATDPDGDSVTYARTGSANDTGPGSITVSTAGLVTVPANLTGGTYALEVRASDGKGGAAVRLFSVAIQSAGALVQGQSLSVTGSGFGTKPMAAPIVWDDCSGTDPAAKWTDYFPRTYDTSLPAAAAGAYRATPFTRAIGTGAVAINHPHGRGTKIFAGGAAGNGSSFYGYNVGVSKSFTRPAFPFVTLATWWERADPSWPVTLENNFKFFGWGAGWYSGTSYWYADNQTDQPLTGPLVETNDDSVPTVLTPQHEWGARGGDLRNAWLKRTMVIRHDTGPNGKLYYFENDSDTPLLSATTAVQDGYAGTTRAMWIGTYQRSTGSNVWRYFADMFMDAGEGWFYLTNNASWASSTIREIQPWTSWSDTSVGLSVNLGRLPTGTVYLHFRKAPWSTGHQYVGSYSA